MATKTDLVAQDARDAKFLSECIKSAAPKLLPDYDMVAKNTGMSKGGAA